MCRIVFLIFISPLVIGRLFGCLAAESERGMTMSHLEMLWVYAMVALVLKAIGRISSNALYTYIDD